MPWTMPSWLPRREPGAGIASRRGGQHCSGDNKRRARKHSKPCGRWLAGYTQRTGSNPCNKSKAALWTQSQRSTAKRWQRTSPDPPWKCLIPASGHDRQHNWFTSDESAKSWWTAIPWHCQFWTWSQRWSARWTPFQSGCLRSVTSRIQPVCILPILLSRLPDPGRRQRWNPDCRPLPAFPDRLSGNRRLLVLHQTRI